MILSGSRLPTGRPGQAATVAGRPWRTRGVVGLLGAAGLLSACTPAHDWREVRSGDHDVRLLFPCRPQLHERRVALAGVPVKLALLACDSGGQTWGLASADLGDPTRLGAALDELATSAGANLGAAPRATPLIVTGATPHPGSRRLVISGRRPDGRPAQMQLALFTHGTKLFQATALGPQLPPEAVETFIGSLRVAP